ncbi:hypothetical protein GCM10009715_11690 [Paeniglutamicibacter psychrophenolicus]|uniref:Uncharacterized short protein YbdD (DUF466 family) n=1 Tax=Paeniglutamicibacter psychrophenolicus TaxID=257454 RepID=A0ABS4W7C8_9MICC|nr:uncharacterized short protein YbdD (DUF466 family) [Paeniglutamicibacter psychrophenolicus]
MDPAGGTPQGTGTSALARGLCAVGNAARGLGRYLEGVLGADKYRVYLEHQARTHPGVEPMGEREFWRDYTDWQEKNPQGRCC